MKHFLPVLFGAFLAFSHAHAQSLLFNRSYPSARYTDARAVLSTPDGGMVFTGLSKSAPDSVGDMYLSKVNAAGALLWTRYYTRPQEDGGNALIATRDGGFLIVGHTALTYGIACDGYVVKTDAEGRESWRYLVGTAFDDVCDDGIQLADGSFLVTGRTENPITRNFQVLLCRISPDGTQIFLKAIETRTPAIGIRMALAADGNIIIAGYAYQPEQPNSEMLVIKCTPEGTLLWQTSWGTPNNDRAFGIVALPDGSCMAVGGSSDAAELPEQMLALHLDANGEILSASSDLAGSGKGSLSQIIRDENGKMYIAGVLKSDEKGLLKPVAAELTPQLIHSEWLNTEIPNNCRTRCLAQDSNGDLIIGGNIEDALACTFLSKIQTETKANHGIQVEKTPVLLFPNPFKTSTYLKVGAENQIKILTITNLEGKTVQTTRFDASELFIQRNNLRAGQYFYSVITGSGEYLCSGKMQID